MGVAAIGAAMACGGDDAGKNADPGKGTPSTGGPAAPAQPSVRTASEPDDPCGWLSAADVEAAIGKLAEPPSRENGCRYTLVIPEDVQAKRQAAVERIEQLRARFKTEVPTFRGPMANYERNPRSYAVSVSVDVHGDMAGELGMQAARNWLASEAGAAASKRPAPPEGWDAVTRMPYSFNGRVGHVNVSVQGHAPDVPNDVMQKLAAAVRDRVPDLPFRATNPYQIVQLSGGDKNPCSLLTRAEAEAVLGPLVVEPYRSSSQHPPLALDEGHACAYFTKGHRVFVLSPTWSGGEESYRLEKGIGGLIGQVMPEQELVVFKGFWDEAQVSRGTGALLMLKGDRLLEAHYLTSGASRGGAVKLAATAMRRLAS
jgi:hypothetical protein